jgi:hypothetical protein
MRKMPAKLEPRRSVKGKRSWRGTMKVWRGSLISTPTALE